MKERITKARIRSFLAEGRAIAMDGKGSPSRLFEGIAVRVHPVQFHSAFVYVIDGSINCGTQVAAVDTIYAHLVSAKIG